MIRAIATIFAAVGLMYLVYLMYMISYTGVNPFQ